MSAAEVFVQVRAPVRNNHSFLHYSFILESFRMLSLDHLDSYRKRVSCDTCTTQFTLLKHILEVEEHERTIYTTYQKHIMCAVNRVLNIHTNTYHAFDTANQLPTTCTNKVVIGWNHNMWCREAAKLQSA